MGKYSKLFSQIFGKKQPTIVNPQRAAQPGQAPQPAPTRREQARKTAADEFQGRKDRRQGLEPVAVPKAPPPPQTPEDRFLAGELRLTRGEHFQSTNVYQAWYVPAAREVHVTYLDDAKTGPGPTYRYWTVTRPEAAAMFRAGSKGVHVWDAFRVRGSAVAHRKNYARV